MKKKKIIILALLACPGIVGFAQEPDKNSTDSVGYTTETIDVGANRTFTRAESTASVSKVYNEALNKRASKNISNSLFGQGLGLTALQNAGNYANYEPTFYVRGLQSLSSSTPLILVDGLERDMDLVSPEEVESVSILKDAAALALYGYKGINGAVLITTKRGKYNSREVNFTYDHVMNWEIRRPEFVNSLTYAHAMNEAYANDGLGARYNEWELNAFRTGEKQEFYPNQRLNMYPNVNWLDETFRDHGVSNKYTIEFRGGGSKFRYYSMLNLVTDKGFIANTNMNDGYSTQNKYSRGNLRTNLDIDLTPKTKLKLNILGTLSEWSRPGDLVNLWDLIYTLPSAAYPIKQEDGTWSGNATWDGTKNPVAQAQGTAYTKGHNRSLFADLTLSQDLSSLLPGLGGSFRLAYDNYSSLIENHSKTYSYNSYSMTGWDNLGQPTTYHYYTGGADSSMGTSADIKDWTRQFNFAGSIDYSHTFDQHAVYSQIKWDYEYRDSYGTNTTIYRQNLSWFTHYGFKNRYYLDLALVGSASNLLAPGHKWAFSPTVSAAWVLSKEKFMKNVSWVDFLKLRASWGIINADYLPKDGSSTVYNYWDQIYSITGVTYPFEDNYGTDFGSTSISRLVSINSTHEKAIKYNIGLDATLFKGLNLTVEGYYQRRKDIWVSSSGKYSSVLGMTAPFENAGIVDSKGVEIGIDYTKDFGKFIVNVGGNFTLNKNEIKEQLEEPRAYNNLVKTGHPLEQVYGLIADGFFKDEADIEASLPHKFSVVKPGDIKYVDVNGDKQIDENDMIAIGYSTKAPEIYYSFHLGVEWKGLGVDAMFQGTGRYSTVLDTKSMFWPLINNTTISNHYYENRWTPDNQDAKYPRLSAQSNANNYQNNTIWLANRSFLKLRNLEVYYRFPKSLIKKSRILSNAKIYVRGVDLFCFDKIKVADPESYGATNPLTRSIIAGLTIGF